MLTDRALRASGISHAYGELQVLTDVSFDVNRREWVVLVGPSGSGKSTLLSIVGLLMDPCAGNVQIGPYGDVLSRRGRHRLAVTREIGWVFQTTNAQPRRPVIDNVAGPLVLRGLRHGAAREAASRVLGRLALGHMAAVPARDLSGGELQRVNLARAMVSHPAMVIADEPTGQLDAATTDEVLATFRRARDLGAGVLVATHDPTVADHADRVLVLHNGRLES